MSEEYIEMGEIEEATPAPDETTDDFSSEYETETEAPEEVEPLQETSKTVPLQVVESMREQMQEIREHNQQLLQLILSNKQQSGQQEQQQEDNGLVDDELITGAQLKALLEQQTQMSQQQFNQIQEQQRQVFVDEQKAIYMEKYPDYNDVVATVQAEAQKDPALAEIIMRAKNPVDAIYKYGKLIKGESLTETNTAKGKVSVENKIVQNLNKAKTLNNTKGAPISQEDDFETMYKKIKGNRW